MADINLGVGGANSAVAGGYTIDNSLKLESDNNERIQSTFGGFGTPTSDLKYTYSFWIKLTEPSSNCFVLNGAAGATQTYMVFENPNGFFKIAGAGGAYDLRTTRFFRDSSAWYHMVIAFDSTQSTASDRLKLYVNGVQETDFSTATYPSQNSSSKFYETNMSFYIGQESGNANCYITEIHWIDGQQLAASDFGEFDSATGIWKPIEYTGTYGNNGFYLDFENASSLGADASGNGNNFTGLYAISSADQATDTPTNNFTILNPFFKYPSSQVISEGNTEVTRTSGAGLNKTFLVTMPVYNGKWYAEFEPAASSNYVVGIMPDSTAASVAMDVNYLGNSVYAESIGYYSNTGVKIVAPSGGSTYGDSWTTGDTIGIALDMDNNYVYFSKNGTWQNSGDPTSGSSGTGGIALTNTTDGHLIGFSYDSGGNMYCNFGGYTVSSLASATSDANGYGNFEYAPPSGYYALCTKNLAQYG
jgi:hypothetical protein